MASQNGGSGGKANVPAVPVRMGLGAAHRAAAPDADGMPSGPGLDSLGTFDLSALTLVSADQGGTWMEVADRKGAMLRLGRLDAGFDVARVESRARLSRRPLTRSMVRDLVPCLWPVVQAAQADARHAAAAPALVTLVMDMAAAADVELPQRAITAASQSFQRMQNQTGFQASAGWKGFSQQKTELAPPPKPTTAADISSSGRLAQTAPGLDATSVVLQDGHAARGYLLFADAGGRELSLQQTKFSLPPQFSVEYAAPGHEPARHAVDAPLARELSELIEALMAAGRCDAAVEKVATQLGRALLKVL